MSFSISPGPPQRLLKGTRYSAHGARVACTIQELHRKVNCSTSAECPAADIYAEFLSVQFSSVAHCVLLIATPWTTARQVSMSITNSQSLLKLISIKSVMPSSHLILCRVLLLPPSIFPSIRVFSNESVLHIRWPKYWSFSFNISLSNEYSGLISFRMDRLDLFAVQGTLKSLLQHHS